MTKIFNSDQPEIFTMYEKNIVRLHLVKDFYFLKWGMGNCIEKPNRLATTVMTRQYFCGMV